MGPVALLTIGHSAHPEDAFVGLVRSAGIGRIVDVRSYPGSRRHPHFRRESMEGWLAAAGVAYRWEPKLGGRRTSRPDSPHTALGVEGFRAYADHMRTFEFLAALDEVLAEAEAEATAVMCAEALWWRCHRRLLADAAVLLRGVEVTHVLSDGRLQPHVPTPEARVDRDGLVVYDGGAPPLPLD